MCLRTKPAERCGSRPGTRQLVPVAGVVESIFPRHSRSMRVQSSYVTSRLVHLGKRSARLAAFASIIAAAFPVWCQRSALASELVPDSIAGSESSTPQTISDRPIADSELPWAGMTVRHIVFEGVSAERLSPLAGHLAQAEGQPLTEENLKASLRQLYASGLYDTLEATATAEQGEVDLIFRGTPATFIGTVGVDGATGPTMNTQLERASQLEAGTRLTQSKMVRAMQQMHTTLEENGYHQSTITQTDYASSRSTIDRHRFPCRERTASACGKSGSDRRLGHESRRIPPLRASAYRRKC